MAHGRAYTPASDRLLAATLLALDGDGYRSRVDAAVSAGVYALIADLPSSGSQLYVAADFRFHRNRLQRVCKHSVRQFGEKRNACEGRVDTCLPARAGVYRCGRRRGCVCPTAAAFDWSVGVDSVAASHQDR
jgi:hypothetical protein